MHLLILSKRGVSITALAGVLSGIALSLSGQLSLLGWLALFAGLPAFGILALCWGHQAKKEYERKALGKKGRDKNRALARERERVSARLRSGGRIFLYALELAAVALVVAWLTDVFRTQVSRSYAEEEIVKALDQYRREKGVYPESIEALEVGSAPWSGFVIHYRADRKYFVLSYHKPGKTGQFEYSSAGREWKYFDS